MKAPKFYQSVLKPINGNVLEHVYGKAKSNCMTLKERTGTDNALCECGHNEWMLLPKESVAVRSGGKPYMECLNCGFTTHL